MKVELHLLQSVPPSNLNRDDSGAPKDAHFGGHRRARLSSQSLKRAIRTSDVFRQIVSDRVGLRTRRAVKYLRERLVEAHSLDDTQAYVLARAGTEALLKNVGDDDRSNVLYYAARPELNDLASRLAEDEDAAAAAAKVSAVTSDVAEGEKPTKDQKKAIDAAQKPLDKAAAALIKQFVKDYKGKTSAADIALFGRMLTAEPALEIDAACQVAHALSVDRVAPAYDYFTAVDDLQQGEDDTDKGAGMIGTTGFTSACFYRYAVVDVDQLTQNLGEDREAARDAVRAFLTAAVTALPSGKQNSFAARVRPEAVVAVVRHDGMPLSLVNAFAAPVQANAHSLAYSATERLAAHWEQMEGMYAGLLPDTQAADPFVSTVHREALGSLSSAYRGTVREVIDSVDAAIAGAST